MRKYRITTFFDKFYVWKSKEYWLFTIWIRQDYAFDSIEQAEKFITKEGLMKMGKFPVVK